VLFGWVLQMYVGVRFFFFQCPLSGSRYLPISSCCAQADPRDPLGFCDLGCDRLLAYGVAARAGAARGWSSEVTSCGCLDLKVGPPFSALDPRRLAMVVLVAQLVSAGAKVP
jgi:hypothetical protein